MTISDFILKMYGVEKHIFYLNDKLVDVSELYDNYATIIGFEVDDNVVRLYIEDNDDNY